MEPRRITFLLPFSLLYLGILTGKIFPIILCLICLFVSIPLYLKTKHILFFCLILLTGGLALGSLTNLSLPQGAYRIRGKVISSPVYAKGRFYYRIGIQKRACTRVWSNIAPPLSSTVDGICIIEKTPPHRLLLKQDTPISFLREEIKTKIKGVIPPGELRALWFTLITGDRSHLYPSTRQRFKALGLYHLLAISGLHTGMVFLGIFTLLRLITVRHVASAIALVGTWAYIIFSGATPPSVRAGTMLTIGSIGVLLERDIDILNVLLCTSFIILLANPNLAMDISFLLSCSAVAGIGLFYPLLRQTLYVNNRIISSLLIDPMLVGLSATMGVAPLILIVFKQLPIGGIILAPIITLILPPFLLAGLTGAGLMGIIPQIGSLFVLASVPFLKLLLSVTHLSAPFLPSLSCSFHWITLIPVYIWAIGKSIYNLSGKEWGCLCALLVILIIIWVPLFHPVVMHYSPRGIISTHRGDTLSQITPSHLTIKNVHIANVQYTLHPLYVIRKTPTREDTLTSGGKDLFFPCNIVITLQNENAP